MCVCLLPGLFADRFERKEECVCVAGSQPLSLFAQLDHCHNSDFLSNCELHSIHL